MVFPDHFQERVELSDRICSLFGQIELNGSAGVEIGTRHLQLVFPVIDNILS